MTFPLDSCYREHYHTRIEVAPERHEATHSKSPSPVFDQTPLSIPKIKLVVVSKANLHEAMPAFEAYVHAKRLPNLEHHPRWLSVLNSGLGHQPYAVLAIHQKQVCGFLPLCLVESIAFGRYLVSMPFLNTNGIIADSSLIATEIAARACQLADDLEVQYLELRQEVAIDSPYFNGVNESKIHMRLELPKTHDELWKGFDPKVRNQIRKAEKHDLVVTWGQYDRLHDFYTVLAMNMRDLGTPIYARRLFETILDAFPQDVEFCVVSMDGKPIAAAMLFHGAVATAVPMASSLREYNSTCANMLLYRELLTRAIERSKNIFDFGRSTADGPNHKFKKQWGAVAHPAIWQYYSRHGSIRAARPDNPKFKRAIDIWQKLPLWFTNRVGPMIVRGIP